MYGCGFGWYCNILEPTIKCFMCNYKIGRQVLMNAIKIHVIHPAEFLQGLKGPYYSETEPM